MADKQTVLTVGITGIILVVVLLMNIPFTGKRKGPGQWVFLLMCINIILGGVLDMTGQLCDGINTPFVRAVAYGADSLLCVVSVTVVYLLAMYAETFVAGMDLNKKIRLHILAVPVSLMVVMALINPYTGVIFTIDRFGHYVRGPLGFLNYVLALIYIAYTMVLVFYGKKQRRWFVFFSPQYFLVPIVTAIVMQMLFYGLDTVWLAAGIGIIALYVADQNEVIYTDTLTGLRNRYYVRYLSDHPGTPPGKQWGGIMLDIDDFKYLNDSRGHAIGDEMLRGAAAILNEVIDHTYTVIRYGGDEFLLLTREGDEEQIKKLMHIIDDRSIKAQDEGRSPEMLRFSMGYALFDPSDGDMDDHISRMYQYVYEMKRTRHHRLGDQYPD